MYSSDRRKRLLERRKKLNLKDARIEEYQVYCNDTTKHLCFFMFDYITVPFHANILAYKVGFCKLFQFQFNHPIPMYVMFNVKCGCHRETHSKFIEGLRRL